MSSTSLALAETELNSDVNRVLGMLKLWFLLGGFLAFGAAREYPKCQVRQNFDYVTFTKLSHMETH